ncbi:hypothetical protein O1611_g1 [Lasiodiplodia mahajangana]|uniref:Uncharacterized protein n=1 Tax=Lasiodiplodia mahajangana TaxID=1108764 RepID=A0ACC2K1P6_9PEZI|nr:hypothetical protein O1611_g1 [Lasiodiplodia mahajangana]
MSTAQSNSIKVEVTDLEKNTSTTYHAIKSAARNLGIDKRYIEHYVYLNQNKPVLGRYTFRFINSERSAQSSKLVSEITTYSSIGAVARAFSGAAPLNLLIIDNVPLYNILYFDRKTPDSEDEGLASDASALENRHSNNQELREEARERLKRKYGVNPDNPEEENMCANTERSIVKEFKKRKFDRDEYNDMVGVEDAGPSTSVSPMTDDSDHKQLMEDEKEFKKEKESQYRKENSHKSDYSEEDAQKYAKDCLDKLKYKYDNPETDNSETDHEYEGDHNPDSEDESSNSDNDSEKGKNISTKIKDIVKSSGGSGGVSSGGSGDGGSNNNNGGSDNDSSLELGIAFIQA